MTAYASTVTAYIVVGAVLWSYAGYLLMQWSRHR